MMNAANTSMLDSTLTSQLTSKLTLEKADQGRRWSLVIQVAPFRPSKKPKNGSMTWNTSTCAVSMNCSQCSEQNLKVLKPSKKW